jgi:hypothetical protein
LALQGIGGIADGYLIIKSQQYVIKDTCNSITEEW